VSARGRLGTARTILWTVVAVALWFLLHDVPGPARFWAVTLSVLLPVLAAVQVGAARDPESLPRIPAYVSSILSLWFIAAITATVARFSGLDARQLALAPVSAFPLVAWSLAVTFAGLALVFSANRLGFRESDLLRRLLPVSRVEKQVFSGLSVTAGICEELVFRGFLLHVLAGPFGTLGAVVASSAVFGLAHAYQKASGSARAGLLGALLALPVVLTGSLWPSMIAHTAIDIASGVFLTDRLVGKVA
jgi:membrane protease YdiL (CAAX protease family)